MESTFLPHANDFFNATEKLYPDFEQDFNVIEAFARVVPDCVARDVAMHFRQLGYLDFDRVTGEGRILHQGRMILQKRAVAWHIEDREAFLEALYWRAGQSVNCVVKAEQVVGDFEADSDAIIGFSRFFCEQGLLHDMGVNAFTAPVRLTAKGKALVEERIQRMKSVESPQLFSRRELYWMKRIGCGAAIAALGLLIRWWF